MPPYFISFVLFLVLSCGLQAQTAGSGPFTSTDKQVVLPLGYAHGHIFVAVSDENLRTLSMLVDTGTERTTVSGWAAGKIELHRSHGSPTVSLNGYGAEQTRQELRTISVALRAGPDAIFTGEVPVLDLSDFDQAAGQRVDGILGWDFFERWCTTLDFKQKLLTLRPLAECKPPAGPHETLDGEWSTHGLMLHAQIAFLAGRSASGLLSIDTGSDATLTLNSQYRKAAGLPTNPSAAVQTVPGEQRVPAVATTARGANGTYSGDIVPVISVSLEGGKIRMSGDGIATVLVARKGSFPAWHWWQVSDGEAKLNHDGSIGNAILERLLWTFDPAAKKIYVCTY